MSVWTILFVVVTKHASPDPGHPILKGGGATPIVNGIFDNI